MITTCFNYTLKVVRTYMYIVICNPYNVRLLTISYIVKHIPWGETINHVPSYSIHVDDYVCEN